MVPFQIRVLLLHGRAAVPHPLLLAAVVLIVTAGATATEVGAATTAPPPGEPALADHVAGLANHGKRLEARLPIEDAALASDSTKTQKRAVTGKAPSADPGG